MAEVMYDEGKFKYTEQEHFEPQSTQSESTVKLQEIHLIDLCKLIA